MEPSFETPEGAILMLEAAYRDKNLEAAVQCKDFEMEASRLLEKLGRGMHEDEEVVAQAAAVLELSYRKHIETDGFPEFEGVDCHFVRRTTIRDGLVVVVEECRYLDGETVTQSLEVGRRSDGWRVLGPADPG